MHINNHKPPWCNSKSYQESHLTLFCLPLCKKTLLRKWLSNIEKKWRPESPRVCSLHLEHGKNKRKNEIPTLNLSKPVVHINQLARKSPTQHQPYIERSKKVLVSVNTDANWGERVLELEGKVNCLETQATFFCSRIINDDDKVASTLVSFKETLDSCFRYLGP